MVPAGYTFYNVLKESRFRNQARQLLNETVEMYQFKESGRYMDNLTQVEYDPEGGSAIELVIIGEERIPENVIRTWISQKEKYSELQDTELRVVQGGSDEMEIKFRYVNELYESKKAELMNKDRRIELLEQELAQVSSLAQGMIPFEDITAEAQANYEGLAGLGYAYTLQTDFSKTDTIPVFEVRWKEDVSEQSREEDFKKLTEWLRIRLKNDRLQVRLTAD
jgi:hypothetical protein